LFHTTLVVLKQSKRIIFKVHAGNNSTLSPYYLLV
jgi:hypothetical protein